MKINSTLRGMNASQVALQLVLYLRSMTEAKRAKRWAIILRRVEKAVDCPDHRKGSRNSKAWKGLEREIARALSGRRIYRGGDFSEEDVDVVLDDLPFLQIDGKYRTKHAHHTFMREIIRKYCEGADDVPLLVTKHHGQDGAYATVPLAYLAFLLDRAYNRKTKWVEALRKAHVMEAFRKEIAA